MVHYPATYQALRDYAQAAHALRAMPFEKRRQIRDNAGVTRVLLAEILEIPVRRIEAFETSVTPVALEAIKYWTGLQSMMLPEPDQPELTPEGRAKLQAYFDAGETCKHCYGIHNRACPRVKLMTFDGSTGAMTGVEFWADGHWPTDYVIFRDSPAMKQVEDAQ